jgi:hypothetical protein
MLFDTLGVTWLAGCLFGMKKIWTRYSGHCFAHLDMNVDIGEKIGHICFSMRGKSISLVGQAVFVGWLAGQLVS